jgi:hypothetical protein
MKEYTIYETLVSSIGNGDSYVVKEFDDLESAKKYLQDKQDEIDAICKDLTNTWKDLIKHFGYAFESTMNNSTLIFEIHKFENNDNGIEESVIEDIEIDKDDFDYIQEYIMDEQYKDEQESDDE